MQRALVWLLLGALSVAAEPLHNVQNGFAGRVWHTEDGLPEETVQAFAQSPDHFLWVGTTGGLVRFDGEQFVVFDRENTPALRENSIFCLLTASDGTLWIGTEGGGLVSYKGGRFRWWSKKDGLANGFVRALRQDREGRIWIGTDDGLFRLRDGRVERMDGQEEIPSSSIHALYLDRQNRIWAGGFHLLVFSGDRGVEVPLPGGSVDNVKSVVQTGDGAIWVGTVSGLQRMPPHSNSLHFQRVAGIHSTVRTLLDDGDGTLWVGTIGDGLIRYANGKFSKFGFNWRLPSNTVLSSFLDSDKNIWIGTQTGLVRLNKTAVTTYSLPDFADADFGTIYQDRDGSLWVGSSHLFHLTSQRVVVTTLPPPLKGVRVRTVFRDRNGALWLGTEGHGAFRWIGRELTAVFGIQPYVRAFAEDHEGGIWIGTDGGYFRWTPAGTRAFEAQESVRALLVDHVGDIWVGKDRGVTRLRPGILSPEGPIPQLGSEKVWAIHEDPAGGLWFGTRSSGLFEWKSNRLIAYSAARELPINSVFQILESPQGKLWISGPQGVLSIQRSALEESQRNPEAPPALKLYGTSDGLQTTQMYGGVQPAGTIGAGGEVWFPSTAGPVSIGPDPGPARGAPPAVLDRVEADGREIPGSGSVDLRPGEGKLEIQYGAIRLRSQDHVRFRYQLEGFDPSWTETRDRRVVYAKVPPGSYRFRLQAFDIERPHITSEASLLIYWRPHFYQTQWFFLACGGILCGLVWAVHKERLRQAHVYFGGVLEERNRLAREMHDTLIQGCTSVSALLEAVASLRNGGLDRSAELLDCARGQIRATADEARRAVWNLRGSGPAEPKLGNLLEVMTQQAAFGSSVSVRLETTGKLPSLDPLVEHDVVMIAREAVYNAVRHGHPQEVRLKVDFQPRQIALQVLDDGCGFDAEEALDAAREHFGLVGMRERTQRMGGRFAVHSQKGIGTEISVEIPLRAA